MAQLRRLDDILGGRDLCQLAVAELRYLTHVADHASYDTATGQRLFALITDAAGLCGWLHYDAARHNAAQYYYAAALRTSTIANDPLVGAHILVRMSALAANTGKQHEAIDMLEAAEQQSKRFATPRLRSLLGCTKARVYAKGGYAKACQYSLNDAERALDAAKPDTEEPGWLYYYDEPDLNEHVSACWIDLRQPRKARPHIDDSLTKIDPSMVRDKALRYVRSAETHLLASDLELACDDLRAASDIARRTGSTRLVTMIRNTRGGMSAYDKEPRVQDLDRHLATLTT